MAWNPWKGREQAPLTRGDFFGRSFTHTYIYAFSSMFLKVAPILPILTTMSNPNWISLFDKLEKENYGGVRTFMKPELGL